MGLNFDMSQLLDRLDDLDKKMKKDVSKKALNAGADILVDSIKSNTPVDTGALQEAISKGKVKGGNNAKILVGIIDADADVARYGNAQEYGTESMIGKKFIKKSFNDSKDEALEKIKESILNDLTQ